MLSVLLFWMLAFQFPEVAPETHGMERVHEAVLQESWFSGTVLIARESKILFHQAYGWADLEKKVPNNVKTAFGIASVSKQFAAAAILMLQEKGILTLDDTLDRHFSDVPADKAKITLHQILSHTSGLPSAYAADGLTQADQAFKAIMDLALANPPGQNFKYSNDGYVLAALLVEKVTQKPYDSFLKDTFFLPGKMSGTYCWGEPDLSDPSIAAQLVQPPDAPFLRPNYGFRGATGLYSTTSDLFAWFQALLNHTVLASESVNALWAEHTAFSRGKVGYGWFSEQTKGGHATLWTRGVEDFGTSASLTHFPKEKWTVIILSNSAYQDRLPPPAHRLNEILEPVLIQ